MVDKESLSMSAGHCYPFQVTALWILLTKGRNSLAGILCGCSLVSLIRKKQKMSTGGLIINIPHLDGHILGLSLAAFCKTVFGCLD